MCSTAWNRLGAGFEDQVQWGFRRPAEATEAGLFEHDAQSRFSGLGAEPEPDLL
jgi:hypothetical protein